MYIRIKPRVIFRNCGSYGYITDNSDFGYLYLNENILAAGDRYVSESGSVMLSMLTKKAQHIDDIMARLMSVFCDVDYDDLKYDALEFYQELAKEGFLSIGMTMTDCEDDKHIDIANSIISENESVDYIDTVDLPYHLKSIHIEVASECNERCVHCYIPHKDKNFIIDRTLFNRIIDECRTLNVVNITLSGGEPLLHKDINAFLKKCRMADMSVNLLSNLTLLNDTTIEEMKKNPLCCVQTSVYSIKPDVHDSITTVKGSLKKTLDAVLRLIDAGIRVQISCPIMKQNLDSYYDVFLWGKDHNIPVVYDYVIFASYDHTNDNLHNRLSLDEIRTAFNTQLNADSLNIVKEKAKEKKNLRPQDPICTVCRYYLCVSSSGNVYPCVGWQNKVLGNLYSTSLSAIWKTSNEVKALRNVTLNDFEKCIDCKDRPFCTICMMSNSNESKDGNCFNINQYHCKVAQIIHEEVEKATGK